MNGMYGMYIAGGIVGLWTHVIWTSSLEIICLTGICFQAGQTPAYC